MDMIKQKMRAALGAVMRIRSYLSSKVILSLYHLLLLSHVRYCISNWCFGYETRILQLQRICNEFIRLVFGLKRRESVKKVMKQNGLLTIKQIYQVEIAIFMYKTVKKIIQSHYRTYLNQNPVECLPEVIVYIILRHTD